MTSPPDLPATEGLGREGLEALFPRLAGHLDLQSPAARERFLVKAFLLLADAGGDADAALWSLDAAAAAGDVPGRGDPQ